MARSSLLDFSICIMTTSNLNGLSLFVHSGPTQDDETDVEAELEVDQLDSDTDPDEPADTAKTHKAKNGSQRPGERIPGHTLLPAVKLENMIQADGVFALVSLFFYNNEQLFRCNRKPGLIERRTICPIHSHSMHFPTGFYQWCFDSILMQEEFIKRLIQAGHREASAHRRNQINYTDMGKPMHFGIVGLCSHSSQRQQHNNIKSLCV